MSEFWDEVHELWWGRSSLEGPIRFRYTRRWERLLAMVWPPKRRKLRAMEALVGYSAAEVHREYNRMMRELLLWGSARGIHGGPDSDLR